MSSFGGKADKLKYTFRKKVDGEDSADGLGEGSKVVILCINGETNQALIIGGVRDGTDDADVEASGHHLLWEFNGVRAEVNNDGEFMLKFGGATAADGSTESESGGTSITMKQNGDLVFEHDNESITLDHEGKSWDVQADEKVKITGTTGVETHTDEYTKINSGRGTKIGGDGATDALVKGTTWRSAEMQRHQTMLAGLGQAIGGLVSLGATHDGRWVLAPDRGGGARCPRHRSHRRCDPAGCSRDVAHGLHGHHLNDQRRAQPGRDGNLYVRRRGFATYLSTKNTTD
jgi:hypothetical protein